jgi:hypothetical protein
MGALKSLATMIGAASYWGPRITATGIGGMAQAGGRAVGRLAVQSKRRPLLALGLGLGATMAGVSQVDDALAAHAQDPVNRHLAQLVQTHRTGPLGQGQRSYLGPVQTSASGMTLALHYASRAGALRRQATGAMLPQASVWGF